MPCFKHKGIFVTGSDTGVGKTLVSAGLLVRLREQGLDAVPMKPVQTGCVREQQGVKAPDIEFCLDSAGIKNIDIGMDLMAPYMFEPACSPHLAAEMAGTEISIAAITSCFKKLSEKHEYIVVEGAGGVMVPLSRRESMIDLMRALKLPVVLVARPGLGTLNHTLLSLNALKHAGLAVAGVFFNHTTAEKEEYIEQDNLKTIRELGETPVWTVPFMPDVAGESISSLFPAHETLGLFFR